MAVLNPQISLKDNASLRKDSDVTMEIPVHTTIAFALTELEIERDGRYGEKSFIYNELVSVFSDYLSNMLYDPQSCVWCQTWQEGLK